MGNSSLCKKLVTPVLALLAVLSFVGSVCCAQGLPQSPYSGPSVVRGGLDLTPSNPLGLPGTTGGLPRGSDSIYLSDQMLRDILGPIPNLQVGYLYSFGNSVSSGRLTLDYILPVRLGSDGVVFAEAHAESTNIMNALSLPSRYLEPPLNWLSIGRDGQETTGIDFNEQTNLSFGGGYRKVFGGSTLLGVNGFYDANLLGNRWYPFGGVGIEFAALLPGNDAIDLTFNWYGILFNGNPLADAFRRGPENYDFQAGYSHELYEGGPDLRLHAAGYKFGAGTGVYGWRGGAELKSRNGMFSIKYEAAHDRVNQTYHTVGGFVNVGVRWNKLLSAESPFEKPEPIFRSPRNLAGRLAQPVKRVFGGVAASTWRWDYSKLTCPPCRIGDFPVVAEWAMTPGLMANGSQTTCDSTPSFTFGSRNAILFCTGEVVPSGSLDFLFGQSDGCPGSLWVRVGPEGCIVAHVISGMTLQSWKVRNSTGQDFDPGTVRVVIIRY